VKILKIRIKNLYYTVVVKVIVPSFKIKKSNLKKFIYFITNMKNIRSFVANNSTI